MEKAIFKKSENYTKRTYWNDRFAAEDQYDWLGKLESFYHLLDLKVIPGF